nr:peptidase S10, serine carboxypeptidase, alpha/beta hydrolase fold protein [Tanacetum cinerariifolium]
MSGFLYDLRELRRYYVPELADIIMRDFKGLRDSTPMMNLKIGNGLLDDVSDARGAIQTPYPSLCYDLRV